MQQFHLTVKSNGIIGGNNMERGDLYTIKINRPGPPSVGIMLNDKNINNVRAQLECQGLRGLSNQQIRTFVHNCDKTNRGFK